MKIIQTFYSIDSQNVLENKFGWYAPEYHLMSWTLSCLLLHKFYNNVTLYTNTRASEFFINKLHLPYSNVYTYHDKLIIPDPGLWAMPKIYTYSLQKGPFLHVDGDVFIFKAFPEFFKIQSLIAQNEEVASDYYLTTQNILENKCSYFPDVVKNDFKSSSPIHAVNAGILGGADITFFKEYTEIAFDYINRNRKHLNKINVNNFNVFFEQHLFYCYAKYKGKHISYLLDNLFEDHKFVGLGNFWEVPYKRTYLHLLGEYKLNSFICKQLAGKLRALFPDYYYRIISLFKQNHITLSHDYYSHLNSVSPAALKNYHIISQKKYSINSLNFTHTNKYIQPKIDKLFEQNRKLTYLKKLINQSVEDKKVITEDYNQFIKKIATSIEYYRSIYFIYLYGRDLAALNWFKKVFYENQNIKDQHIIRCPEINIITSKFNWGSLWNRMYQPGVPYYQSVHLQYGEFHTLVIPEAYEFGFTLYDLEYLEVQLLKLLKKPLSIHDVLNLSTKFFEKDVIKNHYSTFQDLMITFLKQLVIQKAVQPYHEF